MAKLDKDSLGNTFFIAIFLCLVCSIVVSGLAVALKPIQKLNKELDQKKNILRAAGLLGANAIQSQMMANLLKNYSLSLLFVQLA